MFDVRDIRNTATDWVDTNKFFVVTKIIMLHKLYK